MSLPVLAVKLHRPAPPATPVARSRLQALLDTGLTRPLTLISAPAGYGKTTLVSTWLATAPTAHQAWLSLDVTDNQPLSFLTHCLAALEGVGVDLSSAWALLDTFPLASGEAVVSTLLTACQKLNAPCLVVLDDCHFVTSETSLGLLAFLINHAPPNLHWYLTTRTDPTLPLGKWRARQQLVEIRADDLRFSTAEVRAFLTEVMGVQLVEPLVAALESRTEGWVAGLQLAALALRHGNSQSFLEAFKGSHRYIADYLTAEVLHQQPTPMQDFMITIALLDTFCAELCTVLTGRADSQALLNQLERDNLFLIPLDDQGQWYRYHHLFAELLRHHLHKTYPTQVADLQVKAADWFKQQGSFHTALTYYLAAQAYDQAAELIEQLCRPALMRGEIEKLRQWLEVLPQSEIESRPRLCLAAAWLPTDQLPRNTLQHWLACAERHLTPDSPWRGEWLSLQARDLTNEIGTEAQVIELCQQALACLPPDDTLVRAVTLAMYGNVLWSSGRLAAACVPFEEALALSRGQHNFRGFIEAAARLSQLYVARNDLPTADHICQEAVRFIETHFPAREHFPPAAGHLYHTLGYITLERNQIDLSDHYIALALEMGQRSRNLQLQALALFLRMRIHLTRHDPARALADADLALTLAQQNQEASLISGARAFRAWMQIRAGNLRAAVLWADDFMQTLSESEDQPDSKQTYSPELETLIVVRVRLAQGNYLAAQKLLAERAIIAERTGRERMRIKNHIMQAILQQALHEPKLALQHFISALQLGASSGYMRLFLDDGLPVQTLLSAAHHWLLADRTLPPAERVNIQKYCEALLATYPVATTKPFLSDRELEVLRLIDAGQSNAAIAKSLSVSLNTVYTHTKNIFRKLEVHNRTQAVGRARDLGMLDTNHKFL